VSTIVDPGEALTVQSASRHEKAQSLPGPQVQVPLAHTPSHFGLLPAHVTWQGPDGQANVHVDPSPHVQSPSEQVPLHVALAPHVTWHGGLLHVNAHVAPSAQLHSPSAHAPEHEAFALHAT
jgi:hypothetical protein